MRDTAKYRGAIHQASHAVAALAVGGRVLALRVGDNGTGQFEMRLPEVPGIDYGETLAMVLLAGPRGEIRYGRDPLETVQAAQQDLERAHAAVDGSDDRFRAAADAAGLLVRQHWIAIRRVAAVLVERGEMDGELVATAASCAADSPPHRETYTAENERKARER